MDIDLMLKRWGKTALERLNTEFKTESLRVLKEKSDVTKHHIPLLSNAELEMIDNAIDALIRTDYLQYEIIIGYYALEYSLDEMKVYFASKNNEISRDHIFRHLKRARTFIKGAVAVQKNKDNPSPVFMDKKGKAYFYA